ncbi:hypothetical protein ACHMW5_15025 [Azospirillum melinis]|uniref:hypothetical protein n=1 Tax=Azospirillum melinis TaxID=328839 RepID=UPI00375732AD
MPRPFHEHPSLARMFPVRPPFDDRSDVAAVVYGGTDDPDRLLSGFLLDLQTQGFDAVGIVQVRREAPVEGRAAHGFRLLSGQGSPSPDEDPGGEALDEGSNSIAVGAGTEIAGDDVAARLDQSAFFHAAQQIANQFGFQHTAAHGLKAGMVRQQGRRNRRNIQPMHDLALDRDDGSGHRCHFAVLSVMVMRPACSRRGRRPFRTR